MSKQFLVMTLSGSLGSQKTFLLDFNDPCKNCQDDNCLECQLDAIGFDEGEQDLYFKR